MSKREIIIIVLLGVAALYGGYTFLLGGEKEAATASFNEEDRKELQDFTTSRTQQLQAVTVNDLELYKLGRAEEDWSSNIFYKRRPPLESEEEEEAFTAVDPNEPLPTFTYSGSIILGRSKFAIVNDVEYGIGEELDTVGYYLSDVTAEEITIERRNEQDEIIRLITVPLEEPLQIF